MRLYALGHRRQGVVHVIGPELGVTQPGMTIVCGDSHTSTHGAFGALAFGIGTSEVEHVLATQTLPSAGRARCASATRARSGAGCTAKDMILGTIGQIGTDGAAGHVIEYAGDAIRGLSMEGRMTIANMSIEAGGRAGMIAPDDTTFALYRGTAGRARADFDAAVERWRAYASDDGAAFDREVTSTWPTSRPRSRGARTPARSHRSPAPCPSRRRDRRAGARLHGPHRRDAAQEIAVDRVFLGSCTNARIEDLRAAAEVVRGRRVSDRGAGHGRPRDRRRLRFKLRVRVWTLSSATPASSGAARGARCAWG